MYLLANGFTYYIGTNQGTTHSHCGRPLRDVGHDILPDCSRWVNMRDVILVSFLIPILFIKDKSYFLYDLWDRFIIIVAFKAICIFFTFLPPSNPDCSQKKYLNHCFHNAVSGHAAFALLLGILYIRYANFPSLHVYIFVLLYCIFILMTRAHYTKDVLEAIILVCLIVF